MTDTRAVTTAEIEAVADALDKRLDSHDNNRKEVQEKLHSICEGWKKHIDDIEDKINNELEEAFKTEDNRLQAALHSLKEAEAAKTDARPTASTETTETKERSKKDDGKVYEALQKARAELFIKQSYVLSGAEDGSELPERLKLVVTRDAVREWLDTPRNIKISKASCAGKVFLSFTKNAGQERVVAAEKGLKNSIRYKALVQKKAEGGEDKAGNEYTLRKEGGDDGGDSRDCFFVCTRLP